jgi:hypothetical protein
VSAGRQAPPWRTVARCALAVGRRPSLWFVGARQLRRTVPPGWWRRRPFLPLPPAGYVGFRLITQYGDDRHAPDPADVLDYLSWCRAQPRSTSR